MTTHGVVSFVTYGRLWIMHNVSWYRFGLAVKPEKETTV